MSAKAFRAGRLSLAQFTAKVFPPATVHATTPSASAPLPQLPPRHAESHKGDFGKVVLIGGSVGMAGAITLSGQAALRSGAGLVKVVVPDLIQPTVAAGSTCYMTLPCNSQSGAFAESSRELIEQTIEWADVVAIGPGMGRGSAQQAITAKIYLELSVPLVVDADGINALANAELDLKEHAGPRVLTPHIGEFRRLVSHHSDFCLADSQPEDASLMELAIEFARRYQVIMVLKGNQTLITDGQKSFRNPTGNPGMATGGTGDVLTGVITAVIGQTYQMDKGLELLDAVRLAVYNHSLAGDLAAKEKGVVSMIASDLIDQLPAAFRTDHNQKAT